MQQYFQKIVNALSFFTRLPLPFEKSHDEKLSDAAITFPIAGFFIGAIIATIWMVSTFFLPVLPAAGIAIMSGLILTGALHEDGLADCADGLGGGNDKKRALEIMRDSRIGTYGAAALTMTIGLRWSGLAVLDVWSGFCALIIAHMTSRAAITIAMHFGNYARDEGLGTSVSDGIEINTFFMTLLIPALLALLIGQWQGLLAVFFAYLAAWLFWKWLEIRIEGYTGDGLGGIQQVAEITALLTFSAAIV